MLPERIGGKVRGESAFRRDLAQGHLRVERRAEELSRETDREQGEASRGRGAGSSAEIRGRFGEAERPEHGVERIQRDQKADRRRDQLARGERVPRHDRRQGGREEEEDASAIPSQQAQEQNQGKKAEHSISLSAEPDRFERSVVGKAEKPGNTRRCGSSPGPRRSAGRSRLRARGAQRIGIGRQKKAEAGLAPPEPRQHRNQ